jgi:sulfur carrier protein
VKVVVNGSERELPDRTSVSDVLAALKAPEAGAAVAVNDEVVPRSAWPGRMLAERDAVEVLVAVQGG